jgi:hypothetical protein
MPRTRYHNLVNAYLRRAAFALILAYAAFLRLHALTTTPPGLYRDEAMNGNNALAALETHRFAVFYPENNGREGLEEGRSHRGVLQAPRWRAHLSHQPVASTAPFLARPAPAAAGFPASRRRLASPASPGEIHKHLRKMRFADGTAEAEVLKN